MSLSRAQIRVRADIGVRPGDRVSLYSPNRWEWVVAYHAALRAGAVVNPINVMLTAEEVAFVLNDCGAAAIFTSGEKAEVIAGLTQVSGSVPTLRRVISFEPADGGITGFEELTSHPAAAPDVPRPAPTDLSTIGYTSGTTGHPKGAMQSHRAAFLNVAALFAVQTRTDRDVMLNALPLPHVYGNAVMNGTFMTGATLVMMERFDPAVALAEIQRHGATVFDGVPTMSLGASASDDAGKRPGFTDGSRAVSGAILRRWARPSRGAGRWPRRRVPGESRSEGAPGASARPTAAAARRRDR